MAHRTGWTRIEVAMAIAATTLFAAMVWPALGGARSLSRSDESLQNLAVIGAGYALYASDWNGHQVTVIADDIASFGDSASEAFAAYDFDDPHPSIYLGWTIFESGGVGESRYSLDFPGNQGLAQPIVFSGSIAYYGSFRMMNTRPFHEYLGGRYYDEIFYAPGDEPVIDVVEIAFQDPWEWVNDLPVAQFLGDIPAWSSYCPSPAAMFDPAVMRHPDAGGWQEPWGIDEAFRIPSLFAATYPILKTFVLEHNWTTHPPSECNPLFLPGTYHGCEPYYFNHGLDAAPATLFYDLSTRLLPNAEVLAADQTVEAQTGFGLWSRDTPFGTDGYLIQAGYDGSPLSHHILTTDGIAGRDTIEGAAAMIARIARATAGETDAVHRAIVHPRNPEPCVLTIEP